MASTPIRRRRPLLATALAGATAGLAALGTALAAPAPAASGPVRWIAAGGGTSPEYNQLSLEADLALAQEVFGPGGRLLFAGGPGSHGVQVLERSERGDALMRRLGDLFDPRGGRDARYQKTRLEPAGAATAADTLDHIRQALRKGTGPLTLYFAAHGQKGERPRDNAVALWGGWSLEVGDLAQVLDQAPRGRPVRAVVTSCYSGGFAELAFAGADPARGPAPVDRCGFFATTWDREASGCDADPEARERGYGLVFLNALRGRDEAGQPLPSSALDLDGDGRVSLLEAHTRVRVASRSIDVPTTTSERWLREVAPRSGPVAPVSLPEEDAVVAALSRELGLAGRPEAARAQLVALEQRIARAQQRLDERGRLEQGAYHRLAAELLARWPVLDDPWHPDFQATLARERTAIEAFLDRSPLYAEYRGAVNDVGRTRLEADDLERKAAPLHRLVRALDNRELAGRLKARGGADWDTYQRLLACERGGLE